MVIKEVSNMEEKRVVIYARKSKYNERSVSCENQISKCEETINYLNKNPHKKIKYTILNPPQVDDGYSGKDMNRKAMIRLQKMVENSEVDLIIVYKLDRLSRNLSDTFQFVDKLSKYHVDLMSVSESNIDTRTGEGKAFFSIIMVFAQMERDIASERSKDNNMQLAKRGFFMGSYYRYGHNAEKKPILERNNEEKKSDGKHAKVMTVLSINEEEAKNVKKAFSLYLEGNNSYKRIADLFNDLGIKKKEEWKQPGKNEKWTESNIANMIKEECYCANTVEAYQWFRSKGYEFLVGIDQFTGGKSLQKWDNKITILNVPPIISATTFIQAQKMRASKMTTKNHRKAYESDVLLSGGILKCAHCGKPLTYERTTKKNGKTYGYYYCYNRDCEKAFKMANIRMNVLGKNVLNRLKSFFRDKDLTTSVLEKEYKAKKSQMDSNDTKTKELQKTIKNAKHQYKNLSDAIKNIRDKDDIAAELIESYQEEQRECLLAKKRAEQELQNLDFTCVQQEEKLFTMKELLDFVDSDAELLDKMSDENRKLVVHFLVKDIIVEDEEQFKMNVYFYDDLPKPTINNDATANGVKWKIAE